MAVDLNWPLIVFTFKKRFRDKMLSRKQWTRGQVMKHFESILEDVSMERAVETENVRLRIERETEGM